MIVLHEKPEDIAPLSTSKTVKYLLFFTHCKGRLAVRVKRAQSRKILAGLLQHHIFGNHVDNARGVSNLFDDLFRNILRQDPPPRQNSEAIPNPIQYPKSRGCASPSDLVRGFEVAVSYSNVS
jgi:hypothetical protein